MRSKFRNPLARFKPLCWLWICLASSAYMASSAPSPSSSSVKVLLIDNHLHQSRLEQAHSLSMDLPASQRTPQQQQQQQQQVPAPASDNDDNNKIPQQQVVSSLSTLTLHQHRRDYNDTYPNSRPNRSAVQSNGTVSPNESVPWSEIQMPRIKPSWLNVKTKFKIAGDAYEESDQSFPTEYLLRPAFDSPILLKTKLGIVEGVRSIIFNKYLYTFLSVPYARAPVDDLRFKAPQPVDKWDGILQATKWPPFCVQPSMTLANRASPVHVLTQVMTEDCLYLNIWTPSLKLNNKHQRRPVMVWLHGGAFQYGGISIDEYDGSALAVMGDVVVVTLNYRVSVFGFLNAQNPTNGPNNVGLLDQQLALRWVQENIKQYGGDPQQVTLFGESAGGHSVGLHMISPNSFPLFKRAILQSGVPISMLRSYDANPDNKDTIFGNGIGSINMAKRLKCYTDPPAPITTVASLPDPSDEAGEPATTASLEVTDTSSNESDVGASNQQQDDVPLLDDATLECMRSKSSLEILRGLGIPGSAGFFPTGDDIKGFFPNGPITESFDPDALKVGPQKDYLIGTNTDEGTFMLHYMSANLFPSKAKPRVSNLDEMKTAFLAEMSRPAKMPTTKTPNNDQTPDHDTVFSGAPAEISSSGQVHLIKPLLKTSTSIIERFMPKSPVKVLGNGTVIGNTTEYSKESEFGKSMGTLISDIVFLCPARALARTLSGAGRNVYFYLYGHRSKLSPWHPWMGVTHHDEVDFVFGRPLRLADVHPGQMLDQLDVKWPKYGEENNNYITLLPDSAEVGQRYHDKMCNVYENVLLAHLSDG